MTDPSEHLTDYDDYGDGECWYCGGDGFVFECFDGFCLDADVGCDDCTRECLECRRRAAVAQINTLIGESKGTDTDTKGTADER